MTDKGEERAARRVEQWELLKEVGALGLVEHEVIVGLSGKSRVTVQVDVPTDALGRLFGEGES
jgi:hypothetical protein